MFPATKKQNPIFFITPIVLAILPVAVVFLHEKPVPFMMVLAFLLWVFLEPDKIQSLQYNKDLWIPFTTYIVIAVVYTIISDDLSLGLKQLEKQTAMVLVPILIFGSNWDKKRINFLLEAYLIQLTLLVFVSFCMLGWFYIMWADWIAVTGDHYYLFKFPHLLEVHPTYWSYLLVIGNGVLLSNGYFKIIHSKYLTIFVLFLFNINLLFLSARVPLIVNLMLHLLALVLYLKRQKNAKNFFALLILSVVGIFLVLFISVTSLSFLEMKITMIPKDERFFLWPKALTEISNNYFLWGEGLGQGDVILQSYLSNIEDTRINYNGYDLHNQYLKNFLDMGVLGLLALVGLIGYPVYKLRYYWKTSAIITYTICFLLSVSMFTESVLSVLKGIILFAVFLPVILVVQKINKQ